MKEYYNSVYLDESLCVGCINCIKRCPTEAIRVREGKATINKKYCIDCGECIRICKQHAKIAKHDYLDDKNDYKYTIALPAPSLYGQFNNLDDVNILLTSLKKMGFDDVFEVSGAAEIISEASKIYLSENKQKYPIISTACPTIVRLISIRFPNLIDHLLPLVAPVDLAAKIAKEKAMKETSFKEEEIGIFFISPCPSKYTTIKLPIGITKSYIDKVIPIKDIYPLLTKTYLKEALNNIEDLSNSGQIGIGWGRTGGEANGIYAKNYLVADGIERVIRVLEDLEDNKLGGLEFVELNSCDGGCVGGVFTVENPFMTKVRIEKLRRKMPISKSNRNNIGVVIDKKDLLWQEKVTYEPVYSLGDSILDSFEKMNRIEELCEIFPGLDCGSCGAPTCKAFAEDVARGVAEEKGCIHLLRELYEVILQDEKTK